MIIECFGLPGTGKTTIAAQLAARLQADLVAVEGRRELIWFNIRSLFRHPLKYFRRTARAFHERESRDLQYYKLRYIFLRRNALVEKARTYPLAIVDEGHVSNILSAFNEPLSENRMLKELRHLELPDVLLRVTLPKRERQMRLQKRGYFSRSSESEEYLLRWEKAMEANDELLERLLSGLAVRCIHVDGETSVDSLHSEIRAAIRARHRAPS
jgi:thymidylate kinase